MRALGGENLAILPIEQVLHRLAAGCVRSLVGLQRVGRFSSLGGVFFTTRRTAIGKPGLAGSQFELFTTSYTLFDWVSHD